MKTTTLRLTAESLSQIEFLKLYLTEKYGIKITNTDVIKKSIAEYYDKMRAEEMSDL